MSLEGVVVFILSHAAGALDDKAALTQKLETQSARVAARFSREVSHVVFRRKAQATAAEKEAEDNDLRSLFTRAAKVCMAFGDMSSIH